MVGRVIAHVVLPRFHFSGESVYQVVRAAFLLDGPICWLMVAHQRRRIEFQVGESDPNSTQFALVALVEWVLRGTQND